jgi:hypothetical protein
MGDLVWVIPYLFPAPPPKIASVAELDGYFAFYPVHTALRQKLVAKVGFIESAVRLVPTRWRNALDFNPDRSVARWFISDGSSRELRRDIDLTPEKRALPIADVWNHEYLCARIREGWRPDQPYPF